MKDGNFEAKITEVLSRIEIKSECEKMGVQFVGGSTDKGWIACFNPFKSEKNPSCGVNVGTSSYRGRFCAFNMSGKATWSLSFWDLTKELHPQLAGCDWWDIFKHYADQAGMAVGGEKKTKIPTKNNVEFYQKEISKEVLIHLHDARGLNDESIEKYEIGWSTKRSRMSYPVYDEAGKLINIRFHAWKKDQKPKTQNSKGCGAKRLWGVDRLVVDEGDTVCITEGEWDSMLIEQETGLVSVSPTNGARAFDMAWVKFFKGKHVVLVWDCDKEGRDAVDKILLPAFRGAAQRGEILSLKIVWLFDEIDKDRKDFTDFMIKAGGSGKELETMIFDTVAIKYEQPTSNLPEPVKIKSFKDIDLPQYAGQRIQCSLFVHGENSEAYHAPQKILVGDCPMKSKIGCNGRQDWAWTCDAPIDIQSGSRIQLACIALQDLKVERQLQKWVCDRRQKCDILIEPENHITIREVYAHQVQSSIADITLVEKAVYVIGGDLVPIGQYKATGFVHRHPLTQQPTMLIDTLEPEEEDWQAFDLEEKKHLLREVQQLDLCTGDILEDLMHNFTRIYDRYDLHLATLLTLCSPAWIDLPGEGRTRGWISSVIIGDTGTGKSMVVDTMLGAEKTKMLLPKIGYKVSGMTASRTGITYGLDHNERTGWRLKAGAMLKQSGQALCIDEAQDVPEIELKTMADAMDSGRLKVDRIVTREFKAETRCLFTCNPKDVSRIANQKTMAAFQYGCRSVRDIFPQMMIRRVDLFAFAASYDLKIDQLASAMSKKKVRPVLTPENYKALIHYAWNLGPEQTIISPDVYKLICKEATRLSGIFGGASDLPIVYTEDFRKTLARLCTSAAVADLNTDDDFETITIDRRHVEFVADRLEDQYAAKNCQLDNYAAQFRSEHVLSDEEALFRRLQNHCENIERRERVQVALGELHRLDPSDGAKLSQVYLKDLFGKDRTTIFRDMQFLVKERLVSSSRGYLPTPKLFQFLSWLKGFDPDYMDWEDPEITPTTY